MATETSTPSVRRDFSEAFFDTSIRIEKIIWLDGNAAAQSSDFQDFFDEQDPAVLAELFGITEERASEISDESAWADWLAEQRKFGFIVEAHTPTDLKFNDGGTGFSYSFGICTVEYFYTQALDEAFFEVLRAWREKHVAAQRAKWNAAKKKKPARKGPKI